MNGLTLSLLRTPSGAEGTFGTLQHEGATVCLMGELPWRDNRPNLSCIPSGTYRVEYLARSASSRYRDVYHVQAVPGRGGILIHTGNWCGDREQGLRSDSFGCLLPGMRMGELLGQRAVLASRGALSALHALTGRRGFTLEVIGGR